MQTIIINKIIPTTTPPTIAPINILDVYKNFINFFFLICEKYKKNTVVKDEEVEVELTIIIEKSEKCLV